MASVGCLFSSKKRLFIGARRGVDDAFNKEVCVLRVLSKYRHETSIYYCDGDGGRLSTSVIAGMIRVAFGAHR